MMNVRAANILLELINNIVLQTDDYGVQYACQLIEAKIIELLQESFPGESAPKLINDYRRKIKEDSNA